MGGGVAGGVASTAVCSDSLEATPSSLSLCVSEMGRELGLFSLKVDKGVCVPSATFATGLPLFAVRSFFFRNCSHAPATKHSKQTNDETKAPRKLI